MTNLELVEFAKKCLELGDDSVYVYGTFGKTITPELCDSKYRQYPKVNTPDRTARYMQLCDGKHIGFDCVGLIKCFYWGGYPNPKYVSTSDVSANGMYNAAKVKGDISTIDKSKEGLLVQMDGHIGIYIGNDEVIECTISTKFAKQSHGLGGVCKTKLSDRPWLHWCECPFINYVEKPKPAPAPKTDSFLPPRGWLQKGDSGNNVKALCDFYYRVFPSYEKTLKRNKKNLLGDYFGDNCYAWTKEFQKRTGLEQDGCVGPITYKELQKYGFKY